MHIYLRSFKELHAYAEQLKLTIFALDTIALYGEEDSSGFSFSAFIVPQSPSRVSLFYTKTYSNNYAPDKISWRKETNGSYTVIVGNHVDARYVRFDTFEEVQEYIDEVVENDAAEKAELDYILQLIRMENSPIVLIKKYNS